LVSSERLRVFKALQVPAAANLHGHRQLRIR
jgi:hypothetical protein